MKNLILTALLCLFYCTSFAQYESLWYEGKVVFEDGSILNGRINLNLRHHTIRVKNGDIVKAYDACEYELFEIYDDQKVNTKTFYSVPYKWNNEKGCVVAELVYEGEELTVFNTYGVIVKSVSANSPTIYYQHNNNQESLRIDELEPNNNPFSRRVEYLFVMNNVGEAFLPIKQDMKICFRDKRKDVFHYKRKNFYFFQNDEHLTKMVQFYENLKFGTAMSAGEE